MLKSITVEQTSSLLEVAKFKIKRCSFKIS